MSYIEGFYNNYNEQGRLTSKHGQVEFITTMHYLQKYLNPGAKVIEIGAGTGRYSRAIADMGYEVCAVELVQHNIDIFKSNISSSQKINITQGNALDLSAFADDSFDITLSLGPMYHLYTETDKKQAISEALRVTKPGGIVLCAYCISDATLITQCFMCPDGNFLRDFINRGKINPKTFDTTSVPEDIFELVRKEDIDKLMAGFDVERLHYIATDLFTLYMREAVAKMADELFEIYLRYHLSVCERKDLVGLTHHSLDMFRKK